MYSKAKNSQHTTRIKSDAKIYIYYKTLFPFFCLMMYIVKSFTLFGFVTKQNQ